MHTHEQGHAVIWDFDGTLVDSRRKNLQVTRTIIEAVTGEAADAFPVLHSLPQYEAANTSVANWRDLYARYFGLVEADIDRAGRLWSVYQRQDATETPLYDGIAQTLSRLRHLPHGIVSQNCRDNIATTLNAHDLSSHFGFIIGYDEVDLDDQKPSPTGLMYCLKALTQLAPGHVFYVGDHETDAVMASRAKAVFEAQEVAIEIVSIGVFYGPGKENTAWSVSPDYAIRHPNEIIAIIENHIDRSLSR